MYAVLASACSQAVRDVASAEKAAQNDAKEKTEDESKKRAKRTATKPADKSSKAAKVSYRIFAAVEKAQGMSMTRFPNRAPADVNKLLPFVITSESLQTLWGEEDSILHKETDDFLSVFDASSQKIAKGRGQKRFTSNTASELVQRTIKGGP